MTRGLPRFASRRRLVLSIFLALGCLVMAVSAAIKPEPIPELRPPLPLLPETPAKRLLWPFIAAGVLLVGGVVGLLWPRKTVVRNLETPGAQALRELQGLAPGVAQATEVVNIFRRYVATALPVPPGQTPQEMHVFLTSHPHWSPQNSVRFFRLFDPVELAKFAPAVTPPTAAPFIHEARDLITTIENLRLTALSPAPAP